MTELVQCDVWKAVEEALKGKEHVNLLSLQLP